MFKRCLLYACVLHDSALISVPPVLTAAIGTLAAAIASPWHLLAEQTKAQLLAAIREEFGISDDFELYTGVKLYCDREHFQTIANTHVCRITRENAAGIIEQLQLEGIPTDPDYLLADNAAFACMVRWTGCSLCRHAPGAR